MFLTVGDKPMRVKGGIFTCKHCKKQFFYNSSAPQGVLYQAQWLAQKALEFVDHQDNCVMKKIGAK